MKNFHSVVVEVAACGGALVYLSLSHNLWHHPEIYLGDYAVGKKISEKFVCYMGGVGGWGMGQTDPLLVVEDKCDHGKSKS